jgi:IclR helix-turn-helix domain
MIKNIPFEETDLFGRAVSWLKAALPTGWAVEPRIEPANSPNPGKRLDGAIDVRSSNSVIGTFAVEVQRSFGPRDIDRLLAGFARVLRSLSYNIPILVVAPWLSPRTRELLAERGMSFIDLTGNAQVRLDNPALYISSQGASRDPAPLTRGRARVRGPKAGRVVRLLADVRPPYGVREIASRTGVAIGYVSRLLDTLDVEALVERSKRGTVEVVDVPGVLRRFAESYDVFKTNSAKTFLAPAGAQRALEDLAEAGRTRRLAVTGSFAAVRLAPVAAPALLLAYTDDVETLASEFDWLPADEGSNVIMLRPYDPVVWDRTTGDGLLYTAPSQIALDCLTGNGRMPAEGEALLEWMTEDESRWRLPSIGALPLITASATQPERLM